MTIGRADAIAYREAMATRAEMCVEDVDAEYARLADHVEVVYAPKTMPWGNRSVQLRDPEGTAVALFAPVTDAARARFATR